MQRTRSKYSVHVPKDTQDEFVAFGHGNSIAFICQFIFLLLYVTHCKWVGMKWRGRWLFVAILERADIPGHPQYYIYPV